MAEGLLEQFEKVKQQGEEIEQLKSADKKHEELLQQEVLPRLKEVEKIQVALKKSQEEFAKEIALVRHAQSSLELTVMKESQTNRQQIDKLEGTLTTQSDNLFEIVKTALGIQSTRTTQVHEFKMAKWNHISNILIKLGGGITLLLGSGTGVFMIIEHFLGK